MKQIHFNTKISRFSWLIVLLITCFLWSCADENTTQQDTAKTPAEKHIVIFDTDANNELDDQHALAYLLFNGDHFKVKAITVNATRSGGDIDEQYEEAKRIMTLCQLDGKIPLLKGANADFSSIEGQLNAGQFDGSEAVDFMIAEAQKIKREKLILLAVGKLTNVALALKKAPSIAKKVRIVWLGSNYPEPGEYNQENDTAALSYVLEQDVPFEMVTVRYGKDSGTDAVRVKQGKIEFEMPGRGPRIAPGITGRHGGTFKSFGDYSVNLFKHIDYHGDQSRALFDMAAVAIVKNPNWAQTRIIGSPKLVDGQWIEQPGNERKITVWEYFNRDKIIGDFFNTIKHYKKVEPE